MLRQFAGSRIETMILAQSDQFPESTAFELNGQPITYGELAWRVRAVASWLLENGIEPGDRVAVQCQRGGWGLIAALAVMAVGSIYVPITPEYPQSRIDQILQSSCSRLVIADNAAPAHDGARKCIDLDRLMAEACLRSVNCDITPWPDLGDSPAYILYTSGSSGRPKGVVVRHGAVLNTLCWMVREFRLTAGDTFLQKTAWGFTDSLWELFLPLMIGGRIVFADDATVKNPVALYSILKESRTSISQFVPSVMSVFLSTIEQLVEDPNLPDLMWVLNGGEELPRALVEHWFKIFPDTPIANTYGMTESAIYATCFAMHKAPVWGMRRVPIGRAIDGASAYVLGSLGQVLETDQVGEICVGGRGIMDGYDGRTDLTAAAFVSHPITGEHLYRTGDIGSWRPDGELVYLGRNDHQIKIRGMRVELGEVERAVLQHEDVKQAVATVRGQGDRRVIIAHYTVHLSDPGEDFILASVRDVLPVYMVPTRCIMIDDLPMTVHSKADRVKIARLPLPDRSRSDSGAQDLDRVESRIAGIWRSVLGHEDFNIDQGFFAIGGNSLLLVRVYAMLPARFRDVLSLVDLVRLPTIRAVSRELRRLLVDDSGPSIREVVSVVRKNGGLEGLRHKRNTVRDSGRRIRGKNS